MLRRTIGLAAAAGLQLVALVLAHELVFLARYGSIYNEALVHAGHGQLWSGAVVTSAGLAAVLATLAMLQLVRLGVLARSRVPLGAGRSGALERRSLVRSWLRIAIPMALLTAGLLTVQENIERAAIGQVIPGVGVLVSPEYAGGLWITVAVAFAVALVVALFTWHRRALLARVRGPRSAQPRATDTARPRPGMAVRPPADSLLGRRSALRAPPGLLFV
jgi:hypothetical protein